jgi:hypothetical protein
VDELTARILAHQVFNIHPLALRMVERWTEEGLEAEEIRDRVLALVNRAFDLLDRSVAVGGAV